MDRGALADFLRRRREALQPEEVGLPVGARRRTRGLRREELAETIATMFRARLRDMPQNNLRQADVPEGGRPAMSSPGISFLKVEGSYSLYQTGSGDYTFEATLPASVSN